MTISPDLVADAVGRKLADVERYADMLQRQHLSYSGRLYYADPGSLETITTTLAVVQMLADDASIPTPPPVAGCWLTADIDAQGQRVVQPMSCAEFKTLALALYDRNAALWGAKQIHKATIEAMGAGGATAAEILAYDHTAGWPESA